MHERRIFNSTNKYHDNIKFVQYFAAQNNEKLRSV